MEKCKHMKRQLCMSKNWIYSYPWRSSKTRQQFYRSESFAMKTDTLMNGSTVQNHFSLKNGIRVQCNKGNFVPFCGPRLLNEFFLQSSSFNIHDTFKAGDWSSYIFIKLVYFTNCNSIKRKWDSRKGRSKWDRFTSSACDKCKCWGNDRTGGPVVCCQSWWLMSRKFRHPRVAARIQRKSRGWWSSWKQRLTRRFFSCTIFRASACKKCGFG